MHTYYYNPEVTWLVVNHSEEKEENFYTTNPLSVKISKIGPRPPYYCYPRYEQYYPVI